MFFYFRVSFSLNFDWQSRAFFVTKWTPTIVNSSFIGHALLDAYSYTGEEAALNMTLPIKNFLLYDLYRTVEGNTFCFSYTPKDKTAVHNANLLGSSFLIRLYGITGDPELREAALDSLHTASNTRERTDHGIMVLC